MGVEENLQAAKDGYAAFQRGDAEAAMENMADDIEWIVPGESAISGTYHGKQELLQLWGKLAEKNVQLETEHWFADGDRVVCLSHSTFDGGETDNADVLTYSGDKLVKFQTATDTALQEKVFGSK